MPLDSYPFSDRYGWTEDRYGLSWQVMHAGQRQVSQRITPTLMFVGEVCGNAEEAIGFYTSLFPDSKVATSSATGRTKRPTSRGRSNTPVSGWRGRSSRPWTAPTTTGSG
ncbi:MAG: VOC family protein [Actinomycetota bacterium]|nr:VOC family protein [Actinomycetota bacterium]